MRVCFCLIFFLVSFLNGSVSPSLSKSSNINFTKEELKWIEKHPTVKVGADNNWPPFDYVDENGKYKGIAAKYLNIISKKTGLNFNVQPHNWESTIDKIKNDKVDMLSCVGELESRKKFLNFTKSYLNLDFVVISRRSLEIARFDDIKNLRIAVRKKTYVYEKLLSKFENLNFVFIKNNQDALKAVSQNKADIYIGNLAIVSHFFHSGLLYDNLEIKFKADFVNNKVGMATSKKNIILQNIINKVLENISEEEHALIHSKWKFDNNLSDKYDGIYTKEELQWIKNNPIVKVGIDLNWQPIEFINNITGKFEGISSDYLKIISQKSGLKFEIDRSGWKSVIKKIKNNEIDILSAAINLPKRKEYLNFTVPYLEVKSVVVGRKNDKLANFEDIKNFRIAIFENTLREKELKKQFPKQKFFYIKSYEDALTAIVNNKADFFIGKSIVIQYFIEKNFYTNLNIKMNVDKKESNICIGVNKNKKILFNILQKTLKDISYVKNKEINRKWVFENSKVKTIEFTKEEITWLKKHKVIKVGSDLSWAPYSFFQENKYLGILPDVFKLMKANSGIDFEYVYTKNWEESKQFLKNKKVDLLDGVAKINSKRDDGLVLTNNILSSYKVIIGRTNELKYVASIKDMIKFFPDKTMGLVSGYTIASKVKKDFPDLKNIKYFPTVVDLLKNLSKGNIDFTIINIPNFDYYTKKFGLSNLAILGSSGYLNEYSFGVDENNKELLSILNKILASIPKEEIDKIYRKWIKVEYENELDYSLALKVIFVSLLVLIVIFYWNRKLKHEISQKEKVQSDLQESKDFITAIMNSQPNMLITTDKTDIKQVNKAFLEFTGYESLDEFKKHHSCVCDLFSNNKAQSYLAKEKDGVFWLEYILKNKDKIHKALIYKDDHPFIFEVTVSYISKDNNLKTVVFNNITHLEKLNKELKKSKDLAENIAKQKSEFLANMSHEIRTPMNAVIGFTEILNKEITNPIHKDYLSSIKKGGDSLLRIINDILDLSKIEAGKMEIKKEPLNPKNLFLEIESMFHSKIIRKNIDFILDINEEIPKNIIVDGVRLRQILFNIIGNAIKFTDKGYIKLKVDNIYKNDIKSKIDLMFSIEDTGVGIDEQSLKSIFNAFEQQENQDSAKYGGTGLGLAICTKLVNLMNGEIKVKSQKGKGSVFDIHLYDIPVSSIDKEDKKQIEKEKKVVFDKANILVVDDVEENRQLVEAILKDYDFNLVMAENGQVALDKLKNVSIDLVFMDLRMPVMNGYDAVLEMKKDYKLKNIPVIALTASVMGKDLEKVREYGFDSYLRKPVILKDLIQAMCKFLSHQVLENKDKSEEQEQSLDNFKLKEIIFKLENEFKQEWEDIKDKGDFSLIEDFAKRFKNTPSFDNVFVLRDYSFELLKNIETFDIEKVEYLMGKFPQIIEGLKDRISD